MLVVVRFEMLDVVRYEMMDVSSCCEMMDGYWMLEVG